MISLQPLKPLGWTAPQRRKGALCSSCAETLAEFQHIPSDDTAVLLPDDRVPLVIRAQDFDPVSGDIYSNLAIMLNQRQP